MINTQYHSCITWVGYSVYFTDGMCTPSWLSFSLLFSDARYQEKAIVPKTIVKSVIFLFSYDFLRFGVYFSPISPKAGYRFEEKNLKPGEKFFFGVHPPQLKMK